MNVRIFWCDSYYFKFVVMTFKPSVIKKIFFLLFIAFAVNATAQNKDYLVGMNGIGALKIGMSQAEIEKMLNQKFILKNALDTAVSWQDSTTAKYKNINVTLFFQRHYTAENIYYMYLTGLKTNSPLCKTKQGIGIGADKLKIIAAYEPYNISMGPEFEDEAYTMKSKTKYLITTLSDNGERKIIFYLRNKKVTAIEVNTVFNDEE